MGTMNVVSKFVGNQCRRSHLEKHGCKMLRDGEATIGVYAKRVWCSRIRGIGVVADCNQLNTPRLTVPTVKSPLLILLLQCFGFSVLRIFK